MTEHTQTLLLSSNLRRRYSEDILTALAHPRGAVIQFRYGAPYVAAELQQRIATGDIIGTRAVLAFIADFPAAAIASSSPSETAPFIVPVRTAHFVYAKMFADFFVLGLQVDGYPDLSQLSRSEVRNRSKIFYENLVEMNGQNYYPAVTRFPNIDLGGDANADESLRWLSVVERLTLHETFTDSYFLRIDQPILRNGKPAKFDDSGRLNLRDGQTAKLNVSFLGQRYSENSRRVLSCTTDGRFLRVSSGDTYDVALRYDSVEFWLQPNTDNFDSLARVTVQLGDVSADANGGNLTSNANIPVVVKRSRSRLALRVIVSAVGAFLVALPAILGPHSPLRIRILAAVIGAVLLACGAVLIPRSDK